MTLGARRPHPAPMAALSPPRRAPIHAAAHLRMRFHIGEAHECRGVPRRVYDTLLASQSKGKYFHQNIKGKYEYRRVR